jgi:ribosome-binding factor A
MTNFHEEKVTELLRQKAALFLQQNSNKSSLITVTNAHVTDDGKTATIYVSVFPENKEEEAVEFMKRNRPEFKHFLRDSARLRVIPFVDFKIDVGEKNRQKIDELTRDH